MSSSSSEKKIATLKVDFIDNKTERLQIEINDLKEKFVPTIMIKKTKNTKNENVRLNLGLETLQQKMEHNVEI